MSRREKLFAKAKSSPQNISFQELETLARAYGLPLERGGSHYVQRLPDGTKPTIKREGNKVKKWYVQDVVDAIEAFAEDELLKEINYERNRKERK
jgi:hypothetical protein